MAEPHPIKQPIDRITVWNGTEGLVETGAYEPEAYRVGFDGVTRIEACEKPGEYCMLPYVRVWRDGICVAEFSQHKLVGVYFALPEQPPAPERAVIAWGEPDPACSKAGPDHGDKECPACWIPF